MFIECDRGRPIVHTMAEIGKARYRRLKSVASRGDDQTIIGQHFGRAVHALQTDNALPCIDRVDPSGTEIDIGRGERSEEHTSELQSLMRISYAVFCLKKKQTITQTRTTQN